MDRVINIDDERQIKIAYHYGCLLETLKFQEELAELQAETGSALRTVPANPSENMWSEMANVINCIIHVAIQYGKVDAVLVEIERKLDRQIGRIQENECGY